MRQAQPSLPDNAIKRALELIGDNSCCEQAPMISDSAGGGVVQHTRAHEREEGNVQRDT